MSINWRYVVGIGTITGIIGLTTYSIILYKRQQKQEEDSISVDEAKDILAKRDLEEEPKSDEIPTVPNMIEMEVELSEIRAREEEHYKNVEEAAKPFHIDAKPLTEVIREQEEEDLKIEEEELRKEQNKYKAEPEPILLEDEGDGKLRYDPNSDEALIQYMRMELADWAPNDEMYQILSVLFDIPFEPMNDGDRHLFSKLVDYRSEFFGPASRWSQRISFTDLILHFARLADFNLGKTVRHWAEEFIAFNNIDTSMSLDDIQHMFKEMTEHTYYNEEIDTYGIFGLDTASMNRAMDIAAGNIDDSLTYEIEFNEFLKQWT